MAVPRLPAATAMPAPTMARINAYSAAAAPDSSRTKDLRKLNICYSFVAVLKSRPLRKGRKWKCLDLALSGVDRRRDGGAQVAGGNGNAGPHDGQDQRIFGRGS